MPPLPDAITNISHNDHFKPKLDSVDNCTIYLKKDEKEMFVHRFAYQTRTKNEEIDKWVKFESWTIECALAQGDYVVIGLEKKR